MRCNDERTLSAGRWIGGIIAAAALVAPTSALGARAWTHEPAVPAEGFYATAAITSLDEPVVLWNEGGSRMHVEVRPAAGGRGEDEILDEGPTYEPSLATDGLGGAHAAWLAYDEGQGYVVRTAQRAAGGGFGPMTEVTAASGLNEIVASPKGDLAILFIRYGPGFETFRFWLSYRPAGAPAFLPAEPVSGDIERGAGTLAIAPDGDVVVVWQEPYPLGRTRVVARRRSAAGAFGVTQQISSLGARSGFPSVAFDAAGRAIAVWAQAADGKHAGPVHAALAPQGNAFGEARQIGPSTYLNQGVDVAAGAAGDAVVAWSEYYAESEFTSGGVTTMTGYIADQRAVRMNLATATFSAPHSLAELGEDGAVVALAPDGTPGVFYRDFRSSQMRLARGLEGGGFEAGQTIFCPRPYGHPWNGFFDSDGDAGLLWRRWSRSPLPKFMLGRDAPSDTPSPAECPPIPPWFRVTPEVAGPGVERRLDLSGALEPGEEATFSWDLNGDDVFEIEESPDPVVRHTWLQSGRHPVGWRVHDDTGWQGSRSFVLVTEPPFATFRMPERVRAYETVELDASESSDPDGGIASYEWDVEPGAGWTERTTSEPRASYAFNTPGVHEVQLTVVDDLGARSTAVATITVEPPQDPSAPPPAQEPAPRTVTPTDAQSHAEPRIELRAAARQRRARVRRRGLALTLLATNDTLANVRVEAGRHLVARRRVTLAAGEPLRLRLRVRPRALRARRLVVEVRGAGLTVRRTIALR